MIHPLCAWCASSTSCTGCQPGNFLASPTSCQGCPLLTNCYICISTVTCTQCLTGYFLDTTTQPGMKVCLYCKTYKTDCAVCANMTYCSTCDLPYYKEDVTPGNNTCKLCATDISNC